MSAQSPQPLYEVTVRKMSHGEEDTLPSLLSDKIGSGIQPGLTPVSVMFTMGTVSSLQATGIPSFVRMLPN